MSILASFVVPAIVKRWWKPAAIALAAGAIIFVGVRWYNGVKLEAYNEGVRVTSLQYQAKVTAANQRAQQNEQLMLKFADKVGSNTGKSLETLNVKFDPIIRNVHDEVSKNPVYRTCVLTDGVWQSLQSGRAAVNAGISASNPSRD